MLFQYLVVWRFLLYTLWSRLCICVVKLKAHAITLVWVYCIFDTDRIPYLSDSMRRASGVCEGICNRMILNFSYYGKYGVLVFDDDETGPADESKKTKRVQGWFRQIMGWDFLLFAILLHCEISTSFV